MRSLIEGLNQETRKLDKALGKTINAALVAAGLDGNGRFRKQSDALRAALDVIGSNGMEQDEVIHADRLRSDSGRITVDLAFTNPNDSFSPIPISNSMLVLSWHKLESGAFEGVAYLS